MTDSTSFDGSPAAASDSAAASGRGMRFPAGRLRRFALAALAALCVCVAAGLPPGEAMAAVPGKPSGLSVTPLGYNDIDGTKVKLTWTAAATGKAGNRIGLELRLAF